MSVTFAYVVIFLFIFYDAIVFIQPIYMYFLYIFFLTYVFFILSIILYYVSYFIVLCKALLSIIYF